MAYGLILIPRKYFIGHLFTGESGTKVCVAHSKFLSFSCPFLSSPSSLSCSYLYILFSALGLKTLPSTWQVDVFLIPRGTNMGKPQDITQSQQLSMGKIETVYVFA